MEEKSRLSDGLRCWWNLCWRELVILREHSWDFALMTWVPLCLIVLFPLIYQEGVPLKMPIIVVDQDGSALSRELIYKVDASSRVRREATQEDLTAAQAMIRQGKASAILYIPVGSGDRVVRGEQADIFLFFNNSYYTEGGLINKEVSSIVRSLNTRLQKPVSTGNFVVHGTTPRSLAPVRVEMTSLFNPTGSYQWGLVSVLFPAFLHLLMVSVFIISLFRDYYTPCRSAWLTVAQGRVKLALFAKVLFFVGWFTGLSLISVAYMGYLGWPVNGSLAAILAGAFLMYTAYALGMTCLTLMFRHKLTTSLSVGSLLTSPALAYGNIFFPVNDASLFVRLFSDALPFSHYLNIQARSWIGTAGVTDSLRQFVILGVFCLALGGVALILVDRFLSLPPFSDTEIEWS